MRKLFSFRLSHGLPGLVALTCLLSTSLFSTADAASAFQPLWSKHKASVVVRAGDAPSETFKTSYTKYGNSALLPGNLDEEGLQVNNTQSAFASTYLDTSVLSTGPVTQGAVSLGCEQNFVGTNGTIYCITYWRFKFRPDHDGFVTIDLSGQATQSCSAYCSAASLRAIVDVNGQRLTYKIGSLSGPPVMQVPFTAGQDTLIKIELWAGNSGSIKTQERVGDVIVHWSIHETGAN